jgi:hypothetical protein
MARSTSPGGLGLESFSFSSAREPKRYASITPFFSKRGARFFRRFSISWGRGLYPVQRSGLLNVYTLF